MALQAQQVDLAHSKETKIGGTMRSVATGATLSLNRHMFVNKGTTGISVALYADRIPAGLGFDLAKGSCAVNVVAVAAMNESLIYAMVVRPGKLGLCRGMARIALRGLLLDEKMLWLPGVVGRVAVKTTHSVAGVGGAGEMPLFQVFAMTTETARTGFLARQTLETDDFGGIASARHVFRSGPVA